MKYSVKSNRDVTGNFWGLDFKHGEASTERDDLARRLRSLGYQVEEVKASSTEATADAPAEAAQEPEAEAAEDGEGAFICPVCGKKYGSKGALTRHMNKEHPQE